MDIRALFELARQAGCRRHAGNKIMERKIRRAGMAGHKAYLHVLPPLEPGAGCRVTLAFRRPKNAGWYQAHSVAFVKDAPIGVWAITPFAVTLIPL